MYHMLGSCQMQKYVSFGNMITDVKILFHLKEMQLGSGQAWLNIYVIVKQQKHCNTSHSVHY